jgi:hypothetical protein
MDSGVVSCRPLHWYSDRTAAHRRDIVRADIDEVPPFRLELEVIGFGGVTEMPAS